MIINYYLYEKLYVKIVLITLLYETYMFLKTDVLLLIAMSIVRMDIWPSSDIITFSNFNLRIIGLVGLLGKPI